MKHLLLLLTALLASTFGLSAQNEAITDTTTLTFQLFTKLTYYRVNYTYQSVAPDGTPITLSSAMVFPQHIFERTKRFAAGDQEYDASGLMLHNRITTTKANDAPTQTSDMPIEGPLATIGTNYIIISPDGYGFGATVDKPQTYLLADITARNNLDAVKAARRLLDQMGYTYGDLITQIGYSQGGYSTMAVQRYIDTYGAESEALPHIDYTLCGAGPYDLNNMLVTLTVPDATYPYPCALGLIVQGQIEAAGVDIKYSDIFQEPLDTKLPEWIRTKAYTTDQLNDSVFAITGGDEKTGAPVSKIFKLENFASDSHVLDPFFDALDKNSLVSGWTPNSNTRFYIYHSVDDEVVSYDNTLHLVDFLKNECGIGDDRLKYIESENKHVAAAQSFVLGAISELLILEGKYASGEYIPESLSGITLRTSPASASHSGWYTLDGRRFDEQPTVRGLYIHNGRKILIK